MSRARVIKGAFLTLTNKCNLKCKYCYQTSSPIINSNSELKKEDWFLIIDELYSLGARKICLVGGEPFLFKDFWRILDYLHKKKIKIKVFTNGHFINKEIVARLKKYRVLLSFNLNSYSPKIQDFYQGKDSWKITLKAINLCKGKIPFEVSSPLTKRNYPEIDSFINLCKSLGARRIRFVPLMISNTSLNLRREKPTKRQIDSLSQKIKKLQGIEVTIGCRVCEGGKYYVTIQPNGNIVPCTIRKDLVMGNIKINFIKDILKKNILKNSKICCLVKY